MDYKGLIRRWHGKAADEKDIFSRFVFEYLTFIAILSKFAFPGKNTDRKVIEALKQSSEIRDIYLDTLVSGDIQDAWEEIIQELKDRPLGLGNLGNQEARENKDWDMSRGQSSGTIDNLTDWRNMIETIYTLRNNLFHGSKDPEIKRDQLLIENGYVVLLPLVEILIGKYIDEK